MYIFVFHPRIIHDRNVYIFFREYLNFAKVKYFEGKLWDLCGGMEVANIGLETEGSFKTRDRIDN